MQLNVKTRVVAEERMAEAKGGQRVWEVRYPLVSIVKKTY